MNLKRYAFGSLAILGLLFQMQLPLTAATATAKKVDCKHKHKDESKCCHCVKKIVEKIDDKQKCEYVIHAKDITTKGIVIDQPGSYCLDGDIVFNPPASQYVPPDPRAVQAAITIKAGVSNVILNVGNHRISQAKAGTSLQTPYVVGILVPDPQPTNSDPDFVGAQSIYIQGDQGIIDGFSMYGVRIFGHTYDIRLSDLTIKNCGTLASKALRPNPNYFPHGPAVVGFGSPFGVAGLCIGESAGLGMGPQFFSAKTPAGLQNRVKAINLENVSCLNNFYNGLVLVNSNDIVIDGCHFDGTFSDDPGVPLTPGPGYGGLAPIGAAMNLGDSDFPCLLNMSVANSTFNNTLFGTGQASDFSTTSVNTIVFAAMGALDTFSKNEVYTNCQFNNTVSRFIGGTTLNYGSAGNEDSMFINCSFDDSRGTTGVQGFHRSGNALSGTKSPRNTFLVNCTANNNQQTGDLRVPPVADVGLIFPAASGFAIYFAKDVTLEGCQAQDVICNGPAATSSGAIGFVFEDAPIFPISPVPGRDSLSENVALRNCIASRCLALNGGFSRGFSFKNSTNAQTPVAQQTLRSYSLDGCVSSGNQTFPGTGTVPGVQSIACGFYVEQNPQTAVEVYRSWPISFTNCKAMHNKGVISVPYAVPASGTIYSAGYFLLNAQRHSLDACIAEDNIYGFLLEQCDRCTVRNCHADNNLDIASNTGAGFTDLGTPGTPGGALGTPASPGLSTSLFESNRAFANGANVDTGANGNYNVLYGAALVPVPITTGNLTIPTFPSNTLCQSTINVSMTK